MKKILKQALFFVLIFTLIFSPITVYADIGPKPSVVIHFTGLEDETYYVTLLSDKDSTGPYSYGNPYHDWMGEEWVFEKFCAYEAPEGYYFLSYMEDCSDDDTFAWTYYPPNTFKILLYFPEHDTFVEIDGIYERYAFDSYFTIDAAELKPIENADSLMVSINASRSYDFTGEIVSMIARIICTIAVEVLIALVFLYRDKKSLVTITIINVVTQIILNILLNIFNYQSGPWAFIFHYVWMECVVFGIEAFLYCRLLPRTNPKTEKKYHPCWYAFVANVVSFIVGMLIENWIPEMF